MCTSFTFGELPAPPPARCSRSCAATKSPGSPIRWTLNLMDRAIRAVWAGMPRMAGPAVTVTLPGSDFMMIAEALTTVRPGDVLVIDARGDCLRAVWGEYFSGWAQGFGLAGVVIDGATRDVGDIGAMRLSGLRSRHDARASRR